ncbi:MAG TPA: S8 family serine peptidase [Micromonosporaceae bacterium]
MNRSHLFAGGAVAVAAALALTMTQPALAGSGSSNADDPTRAGGVDTSVALVQLNGDPLSIASSTHPTQGKKIDFDSNTVKSYRAKLSAERNDFKQWLRANAPDAKVTSEFDISLNAVSVKLNGVALSTIASAPQVRTAQYESVYQPLAADPDLSLIHAVEAWNQAGGAPNAGAGVKVAIVDTGIDITHPCFSDAGYPAQKQLGDTRFTNNKVIAAKVFNNKATANSYTPEALQEHGTHVAGTVACDADTPATVDGVAIPYRMSGVAPRALLGNYNVFPGDVTNARSEDILNALEAAYADGFDVANMSLGGGASGIQDLLTIAVNDLDEANMVVAVAAGNSGPGHYTVESPGSAARALTAGASTVPHFIGTPVTVGGTSYGAALGDFGKVTSDTTAPLAVVTSAPTDPATGLSTACSALPAGSLTGKIALISRGSCTFSQKIRDAQDAGAAIVLVVNNVGGDPIAMGLGGIPNEPTVPAYQLSLADGLQVKTHDGEATTVGANPAYFSTGNANLMAGFSSQGPTDVDYRVKPDVVAPGVNVLSSIPHQFCPTAPCFAFFQGTSMATPHLAGSAAVVKSQHPDWSAEQIRSAIVNTADQGVLKNLKGSALETDVNIVGAGRDDVLSAVNASVALDPVSTSFGAVPSGSGQTATQTVTLTNVTGSAATYTLAVGASTGAGVGYSLSTSSVTLAPGQSATVTVTMSADKGASGGDHAATLRISSGGVEVAHAVIYTFIK